MKDFKDNSLLKLERFGQSTRIHTECEKGEES